MKSQIIIEIIFIVIVGILITRFPKSENENDTTDSDPDTDHWW